MNSGIRIMIIDDEVSVIKSIEAILGDKYHVEGAVSSQDGITRIKNGKFDLLVLDYCIDEYNGEQVVNEIRKFDNNIYIMFLTGFKNKAPALKSLEMLPIQSYCEKNPDIEKVIISIESAINSIEFFKNKKHTIADRLRELRRIHNLSQDDIAKYLEIQRAAVSSYELGNSIPPTTAITKLAKLFNVTTDYLLCYEFTLNKKG